MSVGRKVARNTVVQLISKVVTTATSLFIVALITRQLGVEGYGEYVAVMAYSQLFAIFADLGTNIYFIKQLSAEPEKEREHVNTMLGLRLIAGVVIMTAAALIMLGLPYSGTIRWAILIYLGAVMAQSLNSLFVAVLQAKLEMHYAALTEIIGRFAVLGVTALAIALNKGLFWITGAVTIGAVINVIWTYYYARRYVPIALSWRPREWGSVMKGSFAIGLTVILSFIYFKVDTVLLSVLPIAGKVNTVEVGIYGSAYKVLEILIVVPGIFLGNIFPLMSAYLSHEREKINSLVQRSFDIMAVIGLPVTVLLLISSQQIITLVAGPDFAVAGVPLRILALAIFCSFFSAIFTYLSMAADKQKSLAWLYGLAAVFNIVVNAVFIPRYSYVAAATTTFLTELIILVGAYAICKKDIAVSLHWGRFTKIAGIVVILAAAMLYFQSLSLLWTLPVAVALYMALVVSTGTFGVAELRQMVRRS